MHSLIGLASKLPIAVMLIAVIAPHAAWAGDEWPPADPNAEATRTLIGLQLAVRLRDLQTFDQVQAVMGTKGKIAERMLDAEPPRVVFRWVNPEQAGELRVTLFDSGDFAGALVLASDGPDIVFNNAGAFVCRQCAPPVDACGHRPGWIPHDLHWDNFDCRCTVTGPQSVSRPQCY
jgi:hypothetical protein